MFKEKAPNGMFGELCKSALFAQLIVWKFIIVNEWMSERHLANSQHDLKLNHSNAIAPLKVSSKASTFFLLFRFLFLWAKFNFISAGEFQTIPNWLIISMILHCLKNYREVLENSQRFPKNRNYPFKVRTADED